MATFTPGRFGAGQRLSASGFIILGLLTFWAYSALRFAATLRGHLARRWAETVATEDFQDADPGPLEALRRRGFAASAVPPGIAAALFAASAVLVAWWFYRWIVTGAVSSYGPILATVAASSVLFYAATLLLMLWAIDTLRKHETTELLVREAGAAALLAQVPELGDAMVNRWERQTNQVALFLVAAFPIALSPAVGAHLYLNGTVWGHELVLPALCFALAALFHVWGTALLVGLYNGHLVEESRHAPTEVHPAGRAAPIAAADTAPNRELVAIMLTDMQGYSKGMERDEARAYAKLVEHNRIMRTAIAGHRGREIKTIGDAFLVVFRSALDAVDCAIAAQRAFADYNLERGENDQILVRIGIHLGDVLMTGDDVYGDGVNVAARIEPLAAPGGICVSEPVYEMVRKKVQLEIQQVEGVQLKNIAIAPRLYRIRLTSS